MNEVKPMKLKLFGDRVAVEIDTKLEGGLVRPDKSDIDRAEGVVAQLGNGRYNHQGDRAAFDVAVGDKVMLSPMASFLYFEDDRTFVIAASEDILGIISPPSRGQQAVDEAFSKK
jgi:chaperonin GroES